MNAGRGGRRSGRRADVCYAVVYAIVVYAIENAIENVEGGSDLSIMFMLGLTFPPSGHEALAAANSVLDDELHLILRGAPVTWRVGWEPSRHQADLSRALMLWAEPAGTRLPSKLRGEAYTSNDLSNDEWTSLGVELYRALRKVDGYVSAAAGWEPEPDIDIDQWDIEDVADGTIYRRRGLVIADDVADRWGVDDRFVPFAAGFRWLPYGDFHFVPHGQRPKA